MNYSTAIKIIKPHFDWLSECIEIGGFREYQNEYASVMHIHDKTTKANIIQDHIVNYVRMTASRYKDVSIIEQNRMFVLKINHHLGDAAIRFKKLNESLLSSNIQTQQSTDFAQQIELPFLKECVHLNVGYTVDRTGSLYQCFVTCPINRKAIQWYYNITSANLNNSAGNIIQLPIDPTTAPTPTEERRVKVKKDFKKKTEKNDLE